MSILIFNFVIIIISHGITKLMITMTMTITCVTNSMVSFFEWKRKMAEGGFVILNYT